MIKLFWECRRQRGRRLLDFTALRFGHKQCDFFCCPSPPPPADQSFPEDFGNDFAGPGARTRCGCSGHEGHGKECGYFSIQQLSDGQLPLHPRALSSLDLLVQFSIHNPWNAEGLLLKAQPRWIQMPSPHRNRGPTDLQCLKDIKAPDTQIHPTKSTALISLEAQANNSCTWTGVICSPLLIQTGNIE